MRITQSMISNNTLRNISNSYSKLAKLDEQIATGKKINRPSDDPVAAMLGMSYRTDLNRIEQYQKNIGEVQNWVDSTDDALDNVGKALEKIRELTVQASNGTLEEDQRKYIAEEIKQLKEQIINVGDTQIGGKYIFGGSKTNVKPSTDFSKTDGIIEVEVFAGIKFPLNVKGSEIFPGLVGTPAVPGPPPIDATNGMIQDLIDSLEGGADEATIGAHLTKIDEQVDNVLKVRANIGARQNRVELMDDRLKGQEVFSTRIMSDNEDVDLERVIMDLTMQESVHRAALGVGAKIMQPTLMDFLR